MAVAKNEDYIPKLRNINMFRYFTAEALTDFYKRAEVLAFKEGEPIVVEGEQSPYFYAVLDGTVNVSVKDAVKEVFISVIGQGEVFGEAAIFLNVKRTANVVGATDAVILRIHRSSLLSFIKERPADGIKFLMVIIYSLLKKLRDANLELAFERKSDIVQDDIDFMVREIMSEK